MRVCVLLNLTTCVVVHFDQVKVYTSRRALAHSLNDTKTAVKQLNKLVTAILVVITVVIWLLLLELATTKVLLFFSTQLVALAFIIGSTCKNLFESIVFVFVMHPYDVGDRCVVDGVVVNFNTKDPLNSYIIFFYILYKHILAGVFRCWLKK